MSWLQSINDAVEFFEVDRWVDRTIVHFKRVFEWLEQKFIVKEVGVGQDQVRLTGQVLVQVVKPIYGVSQPE